MASLKIESSGCVEFTVLVKIHLLHFTNKHVEIIKAWGIVGEYINNNPGFCLKYPGVPDSSEGSDRTWYPLTENYTVPVARATCRVA